MRKFAGHDIIVDVMGHDATGVVGHTCMGPRHALGSNHVGETVQETVLIRLCGSGQIVHVYSLFLEVLKENTKTCSVLLFVCVCVRA